ncbi:TnpA family transposase [Haloactinomyces albus]|uniref:TnpA family transposase n=1 Tax=Haloactinomyces albus TaxID=1352928 RepID=A0AAE3ZGI8_9ACTN|nr:TnpA family transposase [Haloactinomyces albus]
MVFGLCRICGMQYAPRLANFADTRFWHIDPARTLCFGHRGELRQSYQEGMEDQLGALGLVLNAVVLWNTERGGGQAALSA